MAAPVPVPLPLRSSATTSTTVTHVLRFLPPAPRVPWGHWWVPVLLVPVVALLVFSNRRLNASTTREGGSGQVKGIVGRMGSGKSYMAVRIALRRLKQGANVVTNFTMNLDQAHAINTLRDSEHLGKRAVAKRLGLKRKTVSMLWGVRGTWRMFTGWEQFADLVNCVVIIDEAQNYAPSNKAMLFPDVARKKLSDARKYRLDVMWLSQHEDRVNTIIKHLTGEILVCHSWVGGAFFSAVSYEPEKVRRKNQHMSRIAYRFNLAVAELYNTLEIMSADMSVMNGAGMEKLHALGESYNAGLAGRCEHERRSHARAGTCRRTVCVASRAAEGVPA